MYKHFFLQNVLEACRFTLVRIICVWFAETFLQSSRFKESFFQKLSSFKGNEKLGGLGRKQ
jgi:hypothetical protein